MSNRLRIQTDSCLCEPIHKNRIMELWRTFQLQFVSYYEFLNHKTYYQYHIILYSLKRGNYTQLQ